MCYNCLIKLKKRLKAKYGKFFDLSCQGCKFHLTEFKSITTLKYSCKKFYMNMKK